MSFRCYPLTPETKKVLDDWKKAEDLYYIHPSWNQWLLQAPLTRMSLWWECQGRSGFSPFCFAALTGHSPKMILKRAALPEKEGFSTLNLCTVVHLPIFFLKWSKPWAVRKQKDYPYNAPCNLGSYDATVLHYRRVINGLLPEERTLAKLLEQYGGRDWKAKCSPNFDPYQLVDRPITPDQLVKLKFANTLGLPKELVKEGE